MKPVVILAGGLSTRLRKFTQKIPKSMVEVAGEPFIAHQLRELSKQGIKDVVICIGHLGNQIKDFVGDGSIFNIRVRYSIESEELLGTGGAIRKALPLLEETFFVLYGDSWLEIKYHEVWSSFLESDCPALMTIFRNQGKWDSSNVEIEGNIIKLYSKKNLNENMKYIDYGLGILRNEIIEKYPKGFAFDLSVVYEDLSQKGLLAKFEAKNRFYEIGSPSGLMEIKDFFLISKR